MGGIVSKQRKSKKLSIESKLQCLKTTPFFLFLKDEILVEFAKCFQSTISCNSGDTIKIDSEKVYIVAQGELELKTVLPRPEGKIETRGFLCKKYPGDIIHQRQTQKLATEKVCTVATRTTPKTILKIWVMKVLLTNFIFYSFFIH